MFNDYVILLVKFISGGMINTSDPINGTWESRKKGRNPPPMSTEQVWEYFTKQQQQHGDATTGNMHNGAKGVSLKKINYDFGWVQDLWEMFNIKEKKDFKRQFGNLTSLPGVRIDWQMIRAILQFWDCEFRCFTFGDMDFTPTIEEYSHILGMGSSKAENVFIPVRDTQSRRQLALVLKEKQSRIETELPKIDESGVPFGFLLQKFKSYSGNAVEVSQRRMRIFALMIYGMVLFPSQPNFIEGRIVALFAQVALSKINPATAVLAETLHFFNRCQKERYRYPRFCSHLFMVWAYSHFLCTGRKPFGYLGTLCKNPAKIVSKIQWESQTLPEWIKRFLKMSKEDVMWRAHWYARTNVIFQTGGKYRVGLLGPWSGITYSPTMVARQFGTRQGIPITKWVNDFDFRYSEPGSWSEVNKIKEEWATLGTIYPFPPEGKIIDGYEAWHQARKRSFEIQFSSNRNFEADRRNVEGSTIILQSEGKAEHRDKRARIAEDMKDGAEIKLIDANVSRT